MNCGALNIVGVVSIEYLPVQALSSFQIFRKTDGTVGGTITLKAGQLWQKLTKRYMPPEKRYWSETATMNAAQGDLFDNRLADHISGNLAVTQMLLDTLQRQRFIARVEDENGVKYLLGSPKFPLQFKSTFDTKQAGHNCEFYGVQNQKALIWNFQ